MGERLFHVQRDRHPCPKCGNKRNFILKTAQFSEDCCDVWVVCVCRYDPFEDSPTHKVEDTWGSMDAGNAIMALAEWDNLVPES